MEAGFFGRPVVHGRDIDQKIIFILVTQHQQSRIYLQWGDNQGHLTPKFLHLGSKSCRNTLYSSLQGFVHNQFLPPTGSRCQDFPWRTAAARLFSIEWDYAQVLRRSFLTFSCRVMMPWIKASGRGGQPATYTSTGTISSTPCKTA